MKRLLVLLIQLSALVALLATPVAAGQSGAPTATRLPTKARPATPRPKLTAGSAAPDRLLVTMRSGVPADREQRVHAAAGGQVIRDIGAIPVRVVQVAPDRRDAALRIYRASPDVKAAEPDYMQAVAEVPNDPLYSQQWGLDKVEAPAAWDITHGSSAVKIAILDCGILSPSSAWGDTNGYPNGHPDVGPKVVLENDWTGSPNGFDDFCNHGTHVAGIAAASTNNGIGVAGLGRDAMLLNGKVLDDSGSGFDSWVIEGIKWAADNGAQVINMSLGSPNPCGTALQTAVDYAWGKGVVIVAAAGNDGANMIGGPASCSHALAVAATDQGDQKPDFSDYGASVPVAAPGVNILSSNFVGQYESMSGTSMATPFVAGLAALVWTTPFGASNQAVVDRITQTADRIAGTGSLWAYGRINARKAVSGAAVSMQVFIPLVLRSESPPCYTLATTINPSGAGTVSASPGPNCNNGTQYSSGTVVQLTANANPGYSFANWSGDAGGSVNPTSVTMDRNKAVTANFTAVATGPTPGFWQSATGDEFYVTPDRANVADFAIYISVPGCGNYKITHLPLVAITNNQFSFSGPFYASGTFSSATTANGTDGLDNFNISGCGIVSGGPWSWSATWQNGSQPTFVPVNVVGPEAVEPVAAHGAFYKVTRVK